MRKSFGLLAILAASAALLLFHQSSQAAPILLTHGPVVGALTAFTARVFARTNTAAQVAVRYGRARDLSDGQTSSALLTAAVHDFTTIIPLTNLTPDTPYYINILVNGTPQLKPPYPHFKTFPATSAPRSFKFALLTDFGENDSTKPPLPYPVPTFERVDAENPDFVIIGGDFGHRYMTTLAQKRMQYKHLYSFHSPAGPYDTFVNNVLRKYPLAHMWDDHDYGENNADKTYPYKQLTYQVLQEYFPVYALSPYGDWQKFSYAQADFWLLDSRSQRDPNHDPDGPDKSMLDGNNLGTAGQLYWLEQGLLNSTAKWKFIVTPVAFNPTLDKIDSWMGFEYERNAIVKFIRDHSITGVILLSGDSHIGAIDDGTHSSFPEMLSPGPNLLYCSSVRNPGKWSQGLYWNGFKGAPCNGYGLITVKANPPRVILQVKNERGQTKLQLRVSQ